MIIYYLIQMLLDKRCGQFSKTISLSEELSGKLFSPETLALMEDLKKKSAAFQAKIRRNYSCKTDVKILQQSINLLQNAKH